MPLCNYCRRHLSVLSSLPSWRRMRIRRLLAFFCVAFVLYRLLSSSSSSTNKLHTAPCRRTAIVGVIVADSAGRGGEFARRLSTLLGSARIQFELIASRRLAARLNISTTTTSQCPISLLIAETATLSTTTTGEFNQVPLVEFDNCSSASKRQCGIVSGSALIVEESSSLFRIFKRPPFQLRASSTAVFTATSTDRELLRTLEEGRATMLVSDRRVVFGGSLADYWVQVLLLDAIGWLDERCRIELERDLLIDIDDVFLGGPGRRMTVADVDALVASQRRIQERVPGFRFQLGFTEFRNDFYWFPHLFDHMQAHRFANATPLEWRMQRNFEFAQEHGIQVLPHYAIAPHHSGVYPVHDALYDAWSHSLWNVSITATEQYPHHRPLHLHRGFRYRNFSVLPRQECGLYTRTLHFEDYPGGRAALNFSAQGGELFQLLLTKPSLLFMTHLPNYSKDRLALVLFELTVEFITATTNLKLRADRSPADLAERHFRLYPQDNLPVWTDPCRDDRHRAIWAANKTCGRLPAFVIVGPQKSGSTALYEFLAIHPQLHAAERQRRGSYEEVQFFGRDRNYLKGVDWYMSFFHGAKSGALYFEKSAAYFDGGRKVAERAYALLPPDSRIVVLLTEPVQRAYSWYLNARAHPHSSVAVNYTFDEVLASSAPEASALKRRCIDPGFYARHLANWLLFFPRERIVLVDSDELRFDPARALHRLQEALGLERRVDYSRLLKFDRRKGFYCMVVAKSSSSKSSLRCLGISKGRSVHAEPMSREARVTLNGLYDEANKQLAVMLRQWRVTTTRGKSGGARRKLAAPLPHWLLSP